jgi:glycosyltransferase involved in cell wall biosynthesis
MVGNQVDLTIVGRKTGGACSALDHALSIHRWIPSLPREKILEEMRRHDVLVFPSLFEGFGLVVTEALSQGLPVITTSHTCGPDVLTDGREGYLVPVRDPNAIADRLESLAGNRSLLSDMSAAALEKARELSWSGYRNRLAGMVRRVLAENPPP